MKDIKFVKAVQFKVHVYGQSEDVILHVTEDDPIATTNYCEPNDEGGYNSEEDEYEWDKNDTITHRSETEGKDCDGVTRHTYSQDYTISTGTWGKIYHERCYDQYAEAAGY